MIPEHQLEQLQKDLGLTSMNPIQEESELCEVEASTSYQGDRNHGSQHKGNENLGSKSSLVIDGDGVRVRNMNRMAILDQIVAHVSVVGVTEGESCTEDFDSADSLPGYVPESGTSATSSLCESRTISHQDSQTIMNGSRTLSRQDSQPMMGGFRTLSRQDSQPMMGGVRTLSRQDSQTTSLGSQVGDDNHRKSKIFGDLPRNDSKTSLKNFKRLGSAVGKVTTAIKPLKHGLSKNEMGPIHGIEDALLYDILKPLFICMKLCGIFYSRPKAGIPYQQARCGKWVPLQVYCHCMWLVILTSFLRTFFTFKSSDGFSAILFVKVTIF